MQMHEQIIMVDGQEQPISRTYQYRKVSVRSPCVPSNIVISARTLILFTNPLRHSTFLQLLSLLLLQISFLERIFFSHVDYSDPFSFGFTGDEANVGAQTSRAHQPLLGRAEGPDGHRVGRRRRKCRKAGESGHSGADGASPAQAPATTASLGEPSDRL